MTAGAAGYRLRCILFDVVVVWMRSGPGNYDEPN
jgi:hypothetical protein